MNKQEAINKLKALSNMFEEAPCGAIAEAISALTQQLTDAWIPVTERLPDSNKCLRVFVTIKCKESGHAYPDRLRWCYGEFEWPNGNKLSGKSEVIAWKPDILPEPYKEVSDAERN